MFIFSDYSHVNNRILQLPVRVEQAKLQYIEDGFHSQLEAPVSQMSLKIRRALESSNRFHSYWL